MGELLFEERHTTSLGPLPAVPFPDDPMSRTYIGPFGRILPILDGKEPERQQLPVDETRTNMATYQLPPPERLQFGSDTSPGFTEPVRYNTISQSRRPHETTSPVYTEQPRASPHAQLPPVRQLFTPPSSNIPPSQYQPQHDANPSQRRSTLPSAPQSIADQPVPVPQYPYQSSFPQPQLPPQVQTAISPNVRREERRNSPSGRQPPPSPYNAHQGPSATSYPVSYPASYPAYSERPLQTPYPVTQQTHHAPPPNPPQSHQGPPLDAPQPQQVIPMTVPAQYYQEDPRDYDMSSAPISGHEQSLQAAENSVKPMARVVGEADVEGQGPSWVYEDGTTCKKVIDGEEVNAQWGITKAGKPRKRLAIACTTCREKKIKCDPAEPKCVQCEKFGRECRFTTAFRNQRTSPESPSYHSQARTPPINIKIEPSTQPSLPSGSLPATAEGQTLLKRRNSSPQIRQIKISGTGDAKCHDHNPPVKKQRSSLSGPISPKAERKILPLKTHPQNAGPQKTETIHQEIESRIAFDQVPPLLSAKAELKIVDELKARRERDLRAIEQQCEDDCREGMKPCSIMLRLEIMHGGYAKSWMK